jgi:FkbM family methyltransferase
LGPFGKVVFPYTTLGAIDTVDFFGLDELIIFAFCWVNRRRYRRVADVGANIGLHSVVFSRCGFDVRSYEPDPGHVAILKETLAANTVTSAEVIPAAVSDRRGEAEFVRVLGNTTSSHLAGAKNPYGPLERFSVPLAPISEIAAWADFLKIDAEGHEVVILRAIPREAWMHLDAIVEVGTPDNAAALFDHFQNTPAGLFAQKLGWSRVSRLADMPTSYREGSLFVTAKDAMPWDEG